MNRKELFTEVYNRLNSERFYSLLGDSQKKDYALRLTDCEESLLPNLREWAEGKELSDIWINEKYCINAVMQIRNDGDFPEAFIALDEYAKSEAAEQFIWRTRM